LRLLAGKVPPLQKYAHQKRPEEIVDDLAKHFAEFLSAEEEKLSACAASFAIRCFTPISAQRGRLKELVAETQPDGIMKVDLPVAAVTEPSKKIEGRQSEDRRHVGS
jgi:hypothetical protein